MPLGLAGNPWVTYYWQGGIELTAMMLDYYEFTNDEVFARTTLIPMSEQILLFYDQHWKRDDSGKILFKPAGSLETWHVATNPLPEIAGLRFILSKLLQMKPEELTLKYKENWQHLLESLPPVPMRDEGGSHGKKFFLPAESFYSKNNMENTELYAVFPYRLYGMGKPDLDIARETFARRQTKASGGWFQDAIDAACLGLSDEAWRYVVYNFGTKHAAYVGASGDNLAEAIRNYGSKVDPNYRFPGFWGPNYNWIPDQDQPGVTMIALQRMLMQTDGGKILLFPAWPRNLDVEFKLHAPYNTVIEASLKSSKVVNLKVEPAARKNDVSLCLQ
jgi:alpha-L-fucosidase 2